MFIRNFVVPPSWLWRKLDGGIQILVGTLLLRMFLHYHAMLSYGATNLGARESFAVRKPART